MRTFLLSLVTACALAASPGALGATVNVSITKAGFLPDSVTISVGDTVIWTNTDTSAHQVVANKGAFTSPVLANGESYAFRFTSAGRFMYHDAFVKKLKGTVEVSRAPSVTIAAAKKIVVFGRQTTLSGKVSSEATSQSVTIFATAHGQSSATKLGSVTTTSGGAWSFAVKPKKRTAYEARWKNATSEAVVVRVRPRVGFVIRSGLFITRVRPARPEKTVFLQRWSVSLGQWISVKKVVLNDRSRKRFRWKPRRGDYKVRIFMPRKQSGPGRLAGWSRVRIYVR